MIPQWFLYLQGFAMIVMSAALVRMRPHVKGASFYTRYVNLGTLWALLCGAVGVALLAMALGWWTWPPRPAPDYRRTRSSSSKLSIRNVAGRPAITSRGA